MTRPGAISPEALAWLDAGGDGFVPPEPAMVDAQRAAREAYYGAAAAKILARAGLTSGETELNGIRCRTVTPPDAKPDQAVIYLFGGGFMFGSPEQDMAIIAGLATATGCRIVAPYYRLAPEHPFPAGLEDCTAALSAALDQFGSVALAGESAGATLAVAATNRLLRASKPLPCALALMSPASDLGDMGDSGTNPRDPALDPDRIAGVARAYAQGTDLTDPEVSVAFASYTDAFPTTLITTGTRDLFLSNAARLVHVMRLGGAQAELRVWEGMWHAFEFYAEALPEARASLAELGVFLTAHLDRA